MKWKFFKLYERCSTTTASVFSRHCGVNQCRMLGKAMQRHLLKMKPESALWQMKKKADLLNQDVGKGDHQKVGTFVKTIFINWMKTIDGFECHKRTFFRKIGQLSRCHLLSRCITAVQRLKHLFWKNVALWSFVNVLSKANYWFLLHDIFGNILRLLRPRFHQMVKNLFPFWNIIWTSVAPQATVSSCSQDGSDPERRY